MVNELATLDLIRKIVSGEIEVGKAKRASFDLVIRTQEEFSAWVTTLDNGTCKAHSVLLIGDGGNLKFTRVGKGLKLPSSLYQIHGINHAIIEISDFADADSAAIYYTEQPSDGLHVIRDLTVRCISQSNTASPCAYAFRKCDTLIHCMAETTAESQTSIDSSANAAGFVGCSNLIDCGGESNAIAATNSNPSRTASSFVFSSCKNIVNGHGISKSVVNGSGSVKICVTSIYQNCSFLVNCSGFASRGTAIGGYCAIYYNCSYGSNCGADEDYNGTIWDGTNTFIDDKSCRFE